MYIIGKEELEEIEKLFKSKKLFRYQGKDVPTHTSLFEKELSEYIGQKHALFVTSGTNALILALEALGVKAGDEVIIPSYTFVATAAAVQMVGATPVVSGINEDLTIDVTRLKEKINDKTKAIIPVHMDGFPCDMNALMDIAKKHKLLIIEDVAQAVGGNFGGKKLGSFGDASCFSFNVDKIISCGEGGAVCFKEETYFKTALALHDVPVKFGSTFKDYLSDLPILHGHSMRMSEISAVIMRQQLKRIEPILGGLRERKKIFIDQLRKEKIAIVLPPDESGDCSTHVHLKCRNPLEAAALAKKLTEQGILTVPLYARPAHCFWQWLGHLSLSQNEQDQLSLELASDRLLLSSIVKLTIDLDVAKDKIHEQSQQLSRITLSM